MAKYKTNMSHRVFSCFLFTSGGAASRLQFIYPLRVSTQDGFIGYFYTLICTQLLFLFRPLKYLILCLQEAIQDHRVKHEAET